MFVAFFVHRLYKVYKARALIGRLSVIDGAWEPVALIRRAEDVHNRVRKALKTHDTGSVKDLVTERFYNRIKGKTLEDLGLEKPGLLTTIISTKLRIIEVLDYRDDSRDRVGALVTHTVISFGRSKDGLSPELWTFSRGGDGWLLDDIDPNFTIFDQIGAKIFSEDLSDSKEKLVVVAEPEVPVDEADAAVEPSTKKGRASEEKVKYRYGIGYKKDYIRNYRK